MTIGVISDTHGLLRPDALAAMECSDHILHVGDVGPPFAAILISRDPVLSFRLPRQSSLNSICSTLYIRSQIWILIQLQLG